MPILLADSSADAALPHVQLPLGVFGVLVLEPFQKQRIGVDSHVVHGYVLLLGGDAEEWQSLATTPRLAVARGLLKASHVREVRQATRAVPELLGAHADLVEHAQEEVRHGRVPLVLEVASSGQAARAAADHRQRQR